MKIAIACMGIGIALVVGCSDATTPATMDDAAMGSDSATTPDAPGMESSSSADASSDTGVPDDPGPGPTQKCTFTKDNNGFFKLTSPSSDYWVRLPPAYDEQNPKPTRLLVAMHGCGDTAFNFATWGAVPYALRASQDYVAISIGGRDGQCWTVPADSATVTAAITHVRSCFFVHQKKIVLAGYSSGGLLAYRMGLTNAKDYAGILIENSGLSQAVGGNNVASTLANATWKINIAHSARIDDMSFLIAGVRSDRDKILQAGFPLQYRELPGDHNGTSDDWALYLIPKMSMWLAP